MNMQEVYLPAMLWLRKDEADRLRGKSSKTPFPEFDHTIAVPGLLYHQLARNDILQPESKGQTKVSETLSVQFEGKTPADLYDELFFPPEEKCIENLTNPPRPTAQPAARYLHPAQGLPRSEKSLNGLPACLVAGCHPSRSAQRSLAVSNTPKKIYKAAGAGPVPPNQIQSSVKYRGGTSGPHEEWAKLSTYKPRSGQKSNKAQISDPVEFAQVPYHYDFNRESENRDLQGNASLSYGIPPLPVRSPVRLSAVLSAGLADSRSTDKTSQPLRAEPFLPKKHHDNVKYQRGNQIPHDEVANFPSSDMYKTQQRMPNSKYGQKYKSSSPEIPPVQVISVLRFSGIFPNFLADMTTILSSAQAGSHPSGKMSTTEMPRKDFPGPVDGIYDDPMEPKEQKDNLRREPATVLGQETFRKRIRRCKGYENLRVASIPHTLPPLVASSPLAFPESI